MADKKIVLGGKNISITVPSMGTVELKYLSAKDSMTFFDIMQSSKGSRETAVRMLHNQLTSPLVDLQALLEVPDDDLTQILTAFAQNESYSFADFNPGDQPFKAFIDSFRRARYIHLEQVSAAIMPNYQSLAASVALLAKQIQPDTRQITKSLTEMIERAVSQTNVVNLVNEIIPPISQQINRHIPDLTAVSKLLQAQSSLAASYTKILTPQITAWQKWAEINTSIFSDTFKVLEKFQRKYKITESAAAELLGKYKWFVSPSISIDLIHAASRLNELPGNQRKAVNQLFISHFSQNDWALLSYLLEEWDDNPLFQSRRKILSDTFQIIRIGDKQGLNVSNAVLPTLIVQIDGILKDFMTQNIQAEFTDKNKIKTLKESGLIQASSDLEQVGFDVFLDILFQSSNPNTPLTTPFNLNRHKIIHAENTKYGRKDYLIRVIMVLDILAHLRLTRDSKIDK